MAKDRSPPLISLPDLIQKAWDFDLNNAISLNPESLSCKDHINAFWICPVDRSHRFQAYVDVVVRKWKRNSTLPCGFCSSDWLSDSNRLSTQYPDIASEWHPTRNGKLTPDRVFARSQMKVWWLCPICTKPYQAVIQSRTVQMSGHGACKMHRTSLQEVAIFLALKDSLLDLKNHWQLTGVGQAVDMFWPFRNLAIEYDSFFFHRDRIEADRRKSEEIARSGSNVLRLREAPLPVATKSELKIPSSRGLSRIKWALLVASAVLNHLALPEHLPSEDELVRKFKLYLARYLKDLRGRSVASKRPDLAAEWSSKNEIGPDQVRYGLNSLQVWWKCPTGHPDYLATPNNRTKRNRGSGCPICANQKRADIFKARHLVKLDELTAVGKPPVVISASQSRYLKKLRKLNQLPSNFIHRLDILHLDETERLQLADWILNVHLHRLIFDPTGRPKSPRALKDKERMLQNLANILVVGRNPKSWTFIECSPGANEIIKRLKSAGPDLHFFVVSKSGFYVDLQRFDCRLVLRLLMIEKKRDQGRTLLMRTYAKLENLFRSLPIVDKD